MSRKVIFTPEAADQLTALYNYIAAASPINAERYTSAIIDYCVGLDTFPLRGQRRDDIRPNLRVTHYKGRTIIAFVVDDQQVSIIGLYYGGQDYQAILNDN
jgi:toxin ParE1/3/4